MARMKLLVGVAAISGAIKEIAGVAQNLQERVHYIMSRTRQVEGMLRTMERMFDE